MCDVSAQSPRILTPYRIFNRAVERAFVFAPASAVNVAVFDFVACICPGGDVSAVDHDELASVIVFGEQLATHRLEAIDILLP